MVEPGLVSSVMMGNGCRCLHVIEESDLALLVANDGETNGTASHLSDILDPAIVRLDGVGRETNGLDVALSPLGTKLGHGTELGGADGSVILGVGEEDGPVIANPLVEVDGTGGGLSLEVGGNRAQTERSGLRHGDGCVTKKNDEGVSKKGDEI